MSCCRKRVASHADVLLARHAIFGEERLRDEPKECLPLSLSLKEILIKFDIRFLWD